MEMEDQNRDEDKLNSLLISKNLPIVFDWSMFEGFHLWESATCHNPISRITSKELNHVPGFRLGKKVPEDILIGYVGRQNVQKATIESIGFRRTLSHAMTLVCDIAVLDISATTIDQDESNVKNIPSSKGFNFDTEDGDKVLPGFLDSIIGIHRGESKSFPLVFPETWKQENLRGVHAQFNVECEELFYKDLPKLDDSDKLLLD